MRLRRTAMLLLALCSAAQASVDTPPQQFAQLGNLRLENKAVIKDCAIGYRTIGTLNKDRSNAILFLTWHTGKSEDALRMLGPKGLLDPSPYFVIVVDAIGNGVSCSPSTSKTQHGAAFPSFTINDMVESQYRLLTETLDIKHVHAVLGFSMGGMQAFQWMVSHPEFMDVVVPIAGTPRLSSFDLLLWRTLDLAMQSDPDYAKGNYLRNPALPLYQLIFAMNAQTPAYRAEHTPPGAFEKFFKEAAASQEDAADANDSRWQIRAMLAHDVGAGVATEGTEQSLNKAAGKVRARVHVISPRQDHLVNPAAALEFSKLVNAGTTVLEGNCGHFAVMCEMDLVRSAVNKALVPSQ